MSDIAFKVLVGNGYDDILFKTIMLKGEKGDAGETDIDDSTISASKTWSSQKINSMIAQTETIEDVAIASFSDGADDVPVSELIVDIEAVQAGSGVPSPDNVREILGFDSGVVKVSNHSTVVETLTQVYVDTNGIVTQSLPNYPYKCVIARVIQGETYTYSVNGVATTIPVMAFFDKYPSLNTQSYNSSRLVEQNATFTAQITGYVFIRGSGDFNEVNQMIASGTSTEYEQGNTYEFAFGQTVYGGRFDNKGNLVVTHAGQTFTSVISGGASGTTSWWAQLLSSGAKKAPNNNTKMDVIATYLDTATASQVINTENDIIGVNTNGAINIKIQGMTSVDDYNTYLSNNPLLVVYELATPITLSITSQDIPTLLGINNIFANTGKINKLIYFKTGSEAVARMIEAYMRASN